MAYHFIIIDDNKIDLLVAFKAIEMSHIEHGDIHQFQSGTDALAFIKTYKPKQKVIMLVDIQMPVMNGFQFMDEFEALPAKTKKLFHCMFLTSSSNDIDRLRAQKYPSIKSFLNKPFTSEVVAGIIKNLPA
ncbi:MAG: response regulator [Bacteroidia bacterium]|jgi:CheY-like chemotaxis protein|nr:response regulator [Bacteroidia bacterium]